MEEARRRQTRQSLIGLSEAYERMARPERGWKAASICSAMKRSQAFRNKSPTGGNIIPILTVG
jgi:hypothetical protein